MNHIIVKQTHKQTSMLTQDIIRVRLLCLEILLRLSLESVLIRVNYQRLASLACINCDENIATTQGYCEEPMCVYVIQNYIVAHIWILSEPICLCRRPSSTVLVISSTDIGNIVIDPHKVVASVTCKC